MNRHQKWLFATAFSAALAGVVAPAFAGSTDPVAAAASSPHAGPNPADAPSSYSLHSALVRAPVAPAAAQRR